MQKPPHLLSGNVFAPSYIRNRGECPAWEPHPAKLFAPVKGAGAGKALHLIKPDTFLNQEIDWLYDGPQDTT
jgi:hypothetical protein